MTTKKQSTKITVKLFQPMYEKFLSQLENMPLLKDAFIEDMILSALRHLDEDLEGKVNSESARRYIAGSLKKTGPKELEPVSIKVAMTTAAKLRKATKQHNLCRDAFINFLFACIRGEDGFLEYLGFSTRVGRVRRRISVEDMPTSPMKAIEESLTDPLYYIRSECDEQYGCGLYALELPEMMHGFACYLPDHLIPGTPENEEFKSTLDIGLPDIGLGIQSPSMPKVNNAVTGRTKGSGK